MLEEFLTFFFGFQDFSHRQSVVQNDSVPWTTGKLCESKSDDL